MRWTARDIPTLDGRVAIVTGANSGLGFETAYALAAHGARVILACRDQGRGGAALQKIRSDQPAADVELRSLDLASLASIREFAAAAPERLDVLVNNAGVMAIPRRTTADGFEMQFGTNHLGHFALTGLLLERLLAAGGSRVVTVSSFVANFGKIDFDDLQHERSYRRWGVYAQSKLANQLFTLELDRRVGGRLVSAAAHPGYASTNLQGGAARMEDHRLMERLADMQNAVFAQSAAAGALPTLYAATAPDVAGGRYFSPGGVLRLRGYPKPDAFVRAARDADRAARLWKTSEELTGVSYPAV
jgi:NAD(P)-dependent dehydrogenase (short-subunit alcohol dehydrogenase family)